MHSSGAFIRTHLCTKSCIESKSAFITFCMKHPSSGLTTHHVQRCLRRVMTPSVPWGLDMSAASGEGAWWGTQRASPCICPYSPCREWGGGLDKVHSVPAPVASGEGCLIRHTACQPLYLSLFSMWAIVFTALKSSNPISSHFLDHICQDWTIPNILFFRL